MTKGKTPSTIKHDYKRPLKQNIIKNKKQIRV
jgi:hypothetical protein